MKDLRWLLDTPVAHRGYHGPGIPENSGAAFREAIKNGYPIELDIRMTKDNVIVVFHDDNLFRLTSYNKNIGDCTFAEIRELFLDSTNERIPAFTEVLDYIKGRVGLLVEIKQHPVTGSVEEHLSRILDRYSGKFAVASFDPHILRWFLRNRPSSIRCQIVGGPHGKKLSVLQQFLLKDLYVTLVSRPDIIAYEYQILNSWIRLFADIFRIPVIVWTVREAETAKKLRETGQNFIFEGFPCNKM
jgi:glycerophosphoryl diester phosphodiesterase